MTIINIILYQFLGGTGQTITYKSKREQYLDDAIQAEIDKFQSLAKTFDLNEEEKKLKELQRISDSIEVGFFHSL